MIRKTLLAASFAATLATPMLAQADYKPLAEDPKEISFGIIATESTVGLKEQWLPFLKDMEATIGMPVKPFFATDYAGVIEAMRFGKVQVAWFGNKSGMEAVNRAGGEVFAQTSHEDGTAGYYSYIIANAANDKMNSLKDLLKCDQSLNFGMGDPNSTSGFLVPSYYVFAKNGADPKTCFKTMRNANHETNFLAVANGQVDAATNNSEQEAIMKEKRPEIAAKVKVIYRSPIIPSDPMVYRKDLSREMKNRIKAFFLSYGRYGDNAEHAKKVLAGISGGLGPFMDSSNKQLIPIRQLALFKDKLKLEADEHLDAAEKKKRLASIDQQLGVLAVLQDNEALY